VTIDFQIGRRKFVAAAAVLAVARYAAAQPRPRPVIGFLNGAAYELSSHLVAAFHRGLGEMGYVEGRNVDFDYRSAEGKYDRLPGLAEDLVRRKVDLIAATGTPTGLPAKNATSTIPIVFVTGSDPIEQGLVTSLSRPGGNITGATTLAVELGRKRLELLRELIPGLSMIGALINPKGPNLKAVLHNVQEAAAALNLRVHIVHASTVLDFDDAFAALRNLGVRTLVIGTDTFFNSQSLRLGELTRRYGLAAIYQYREFTAGGGLLSYAGAIGEAYRIIGIYAGRILKGEKTGDLPVQQSTKAELFINLATARALGIVVPQSILVRADEVLQ
jgi:putative tryptophan/tyrosine transport system substrate-binding protein